MRRARPGDADTTPSGTSSESAASSRLSSKSKVRVLQRREEAQAPGLARGEVQRSLASRKCARRATVNGNLNGTEPPPRLPRPPVPRVLRRVRAQVRRSKVRVQPVAQRGPKVVRGERARPLASHKCAGEPLSQPPGRLGAAATARSGRSDSKWPGERDKRHHNPNVPTVTTKWRR